MISSGDFFASLDLKYAYNSVPTARTADVF